MLLLAALLMVICGAETLLKPCSRKHHEVLDCDHVIVGAGPAGAFEAYELSRRFPDLDICLFEKESEPGGRFADRLQPDTGVRIPMGGMRWLEFGNFSMSIFTKYAEELGIVRDPDLQTDVFGARASKLRGVWARNGQEHVACYTNELAFRNASNTASAIYRALQDKYRSDIDFVSDQGSMRHFVQTFLGDETSEFLRNSEALRSLMERPMDAPSYMSNNLWYRFDGPRSYPHGGMSEFPRRMVERFIQQGGQFFPREQVVQVGYQNGRYNVLTHKYRAYPSSVALAIPKYNYDTLRGNVVEKILAASEYRAVDSYGCVTVAQVWPERFYESVSNDAIFKWGQATSTAGMGNYAHVFTESTPYNFNANMTRTVYVDDPSKVEWWRNLYAQKGIPGVEKEAIRFMQQIYPNVTIPQPVKTLFYYTPGIIAHPRGGSHAQGITNAHLLEWAVEPLNSLPSCSLHLPADTWNPRMTGWAVAGWKISSEWMKKCYNVTDIDNDSDFCKPFTEPPLSRTWCDCLPGTNVPPEGQAYIDENCPIRTGDFEATHVIRPVEW